MLLHIHIHVDVTTCIYRQPMLLHIHNNQYYYNNYRQPHVHIENQCIIITTCRKPMLL